MTTKLKLDFQKSPKNGPKAGPGGELDHGPIKFFVIKDPGDPGLKFERASWTKKIQPSKYKG